VIKERTPLMAEQLKLSAKLIDFDIVEDYGTGQDDAA
jgi:hypothetical protein